jgi:cell division protein FtsN
VPIDLLEDLETHVSDLAISFESIEGPSSLLSEETKERLSSAAALSLKIVHGKGVANASADELHSEGIGSVSAAEKPAPVAKIVPTASTAKKTAAVSSSVAENPKHEMKSAAPIPALVRSQPKPVPVRIAAKPSPSEQNSATVKRTLPAFASPVKPGTQIASKPSAQTAPPVSQWTPKPGIDGYVLQVASFSTMANATALKVKLGESVDRVFIQKFESGDRTLFRVRVGAFETIEDSTPAMESLQAAGYEPLYVR